MVEAIATKAKAANSAAQVGQGPVHVVSSKADQMFLDIIAANPDYRRFPHYKGDLELVNHSAGSLTSEAYHKRWNRLKELLGDAAEKASVAAMWLGGQPYPQQRLNRAWMLLLAGQMHDILPGTATPKAYEFAWNDDVIVMNQLADMLSSATARVASGLDTQTQGTALVVYNPLNVAREDLVEANVSLPAGTTAVRVTGPDGQPVAAQVQGRPGVRGAQVLFVAKAPSVGFAVYDVQQDAEPADQAAVLKVSASSLENARYRVKLDANGDVSSIFDKAINKELLSAPMRLAISEDNPREWPAWNMDWNQVQRRAAGLGQRTRQGASHGKRPCPRGPGSHAGDRRLEVRRDRSPLERGCGESSRVCQRHRLEGQAVQSQGHLPPVGRQSQCNLQLGHRHDSASDGKRPSVRGRLAPVDRSDRRVRRLSAPRS